MTAEAAPSGVPPVALDAVPSSITDQRQLAFKRWSDIVIDYGGRYGEHSEKTALSTPERRKMYNDMLGLLLPKGLREYIESKRLDFMFDMFERDNADALHALMDIHERDPVLCPFDVNTPAMWMREAFNLTDETVFTRVTSLCTDVSLNRRGRGGETPLSFSLQGFFSLVGYEDRAWHVRYRRVKTFLERAEQDGTGVCVVDDTKHTGCVCIGGGPGTIDRVEEGKDKRKVLTARWHTPALYFQHLWFEGVELNPGRFVPLGELSAVHPERYSLLSELGGVIRNAEERVMAYRAKFPAALDAVLSIPLPVDALRHLVIASYVLAPS
jgi:hypothetical protein